MMKWTLDGWSCHNQAGRRRLPRIYCWYSSYAGVTWESFKCDRMWNLTEERRSSTGRACKPLRYSGSRLSSVTRHRFDWHQCMLDVALKIPPCTPPLHVQLWLSQLRLNFENYTQRQRHIAFFRAVYCTFWHETAVTVCVSPYMQNGTSRWCPTNLGYSWRSHVYPG